jgi:copper resistance protein B
MSRLSMVFLASFIVGAASAQDHSTHEHQPTSSPGVSSHAPPDPPTHAMRDMSEREMIELMEMDDAAAVLSIRADALEWRHHDEKDEFSWDVRGWYGNDYDKLMLKSEGAVVEGDTDARVELLWDRVIGRWWSVQAGVRHDVHEGPSRTWIAFGLQGLAPQWFEIEATAYLGEEGRSALRVGVDYELLLTQRLILEPKLEVNMFGKADKENLIGSGLSDTELALRLRYEIRRELAPYVGVAWTRLQGNTADMAESVARDSNDVQWLAGVRWWF